MAYLLVETADELCQELQRLQERLPLPHYSQAESVCSCCKGYVGSLCRNVSCWWARVCCFTGFVYLSITRFTCCWVFCSGNNPTPGYLLHVSFLGSFI